MNDAEVVVTHCSDVVYAVDYDKDRDYDDSCTNIWMVVRRVPNLHQPTMQDWGLIVSWLSHRQMRAITGRCYEVSQGRRCSGDSLPFEHGCLITMENHWLEGKAKREERVECYQISHTTFAEWICLGEYIGRTNLSIRGVLLMACISLQMSC
jgi:hypothetical protein